MNRWVALILLIALGVAAAFRVPDLASRPMHNDEGVNAYKFAQLWRTGDYKYDHNEHHGPTLYYAAYAWCWVTGSPSVAQLTDARLRALTVVFGLAIIAILPLFVDALGRRGIIYASLIMAISPAMVFYSRYFIHEILLIFFTVLALGAGWRYWRSRKLGWALLAGAAIGLMDATKETFVITLAAAALALALNQAWNRWMDASGPPTRAPTLAWSHMAAALAIWVAVVWIFFSSFFANPAGPLDSLRSYIPWLNRAGGDSPHIHPWYFYFHRLLWFQLPKGPVFTELAIFGLAIVGAWAGFARRRLGRASASFVRFLVIFTASTAGAYSVISYKTPWCLLNFWVGAVLLAGVGVAFIVRSLRIRYLRFAFGTVLLLAAAHLGYQSWGMNTTYAADVRNPHVYAHTSADFSRLVQMITRIGAVATSPVTIKIMAPDHDFWPMPWYFRSYNAGYYDALPPDPFAPLMVVSSKYGAHLDERKTHLMTGYYQLRPGVFFELYVELELWKLFLAKNPPSQSPPEED